MHSAPPPDHDAVLAVAEELLGTDGPGGLSVRRIADRLGVSRQIVYSRFVDKPGLVRALHARGFDRLVAGFATVEERPVTPDLLVLMALAYRDVALRQPAVYELMFGAPVVGFVPDARARAVAAAAFAPVVRAAGEWLAQERPGSTAVETLTLARSLWSATHGVVALELAGLLGPEAPALVTGLVGAVVAAAREEPARPVTADPGPPARRGRRG